MNSHSTALFKWWTGGALLCLWLSAAPVWAAGAAPGSVDLLMDVSGLTEQYQDMTEDVTAAMQLQREHFYMLSDTDFERLTGRVVSLVEPERVLQGIREEIENSMREEEVQQLLTWYQSDLGRKITAAEVAASTRSAHRQMMALKELQLKKTERIAFARRFDDLLDLSTFALEYHKLQQEAMAISLIEILGAEAGLDPDHFRRNLERYEEDILEEARDMIAVSIVFTYRRLSDEELEKYYKFNSQDYSLKLSRAVFKGALEAMRSQLRQLSEATPLSAP